MARKTAYLLLTAKNLDIIFPHLYDSWSVLPVLRAVGGVVSLVLVVRDAEE